MGKRIKRVLFINSFCGSGSTGKICLNLAKEYESKGYEAKIAFGRDPLPEDAVQYAIRIGTKKDYIVHALKARILDSVGFESKKATKNFLKWADKYDPDILWLHNLHGYYINVELLFEWIKSRPNMVVKWTLHDCWPFTGHCAYFSYINCEQWKKQCCNCLELKKYPICYTSGNVRKNFERKKNSFTGVANLTLITPSKWLSNIVKQSFLKEYKTNVVYNNIDKEIFRPTISSFREELGLIGKKVILGVANVWDERKGLRDFYKLSKMLNHDYAIVLVGMNKKQINRLPNDVKGFVCVSNPTQYIHIFNYDENTIKNSSEGAFLKTKATNQDFNNIKQSQTKDMKKTEIDGNVIIPQNVESIYEAITGNIWLYERENSDHVSCIVCIERTDSSKELAKIYTSADYFVNPTYQDNYPTVNLEAIACGLRVITYDTGGCKETIINSKTKD